VQAEELDEAYFSTIKLTNSQLVAGRMKYTFRHLKETKLPQKLPPEVYPSGRILGVSLAKSIAVCQLCRFANAWKAASRILKENIQGRVTPIKASKCP
jgi:hypothetical protein